MSQPAVEFVEGICAGAELLIRSSHATHIRYRVGR
jgi:hypothetical protein